MNEFQKQSFHKSQHALPYARIAGLYDHLMAHVDYQEWADYIEACYRQFGEGIKCVLDGGCGTGSLMHALQMRGFSVAGFDLSGDMIQIARSKGLKHVWQGDLRSIAAAGLFDSVICLYDTIHYLTETEIAGFFLDVWRLLPPGGLFIFDAVTEIHVRNYWADYTEKGEESGCVYLRRSWYEPACRCQHTEFEITVESENKTFQEHHRQWIYPVPFLIENAENCGFTLCGVFDECTFEDGHTHSDRVHLVLSRRLS